ncbi:MAG: aminoacyl-tRNA hydrolase [Firmicutes bacterium]|nr:aminoacyl-tRNA hydrolase [Bacillota bacterium]
MKIIFGLGNPGPQYEATRHNCGFITLDHIADDLGVSFSRRAEDNLLAEAFYKGEKLLLAKPQSFMNLSGFPLSRLVNYYKLPFEDILVIHDDMDLPCAHLRFKRGGSDGGHNGIKSIIEQTGTCGINRLKIGIGAAEHDAVDHVIGRFYPEEESLFAEAFPKAAEAALCWMTDGISFAMNKYNNWQPEAKDMPAAEKD